jgi:YVTN family beta-propeller protein
MAVLSCLFAAACDVSGARAESGHSLLYVSNEAGNSISVIDANDDVVVRTIDVGKRPRGMKLSRDGKLVYVALSGSPRGGPNVDETALPPPDRAADGIGLIDGASARYRGKIAAGNDPESFDLTPDGKLLVVANEDAARATLLDPNTRTVVAEVPVGVEPEGVCIAPDGKHAFVTSEGENRVDVIDIASRSLVARIATGERPRNVLFAGNGELAFVAAELSSSVDVLDTKGLRRVASVVIPGEPRARPMGMALDEPRHRLYVTTGRAGGVAVIDTERLVFERTISAVGARPWGISLNEDGTKLYTANGPSNDVSVIDTKTFTVLKRIRVGELPWGLALSPR